MTRRAAAVLSGLMLAFFVSSCAENDVIAPTPTTGVIEGQLDPVGAASTITLTAANGQVSSVAPDVTTGKFMFRDLAAGVYSLGAVPVTGYNIPTAVALTVKAGAVTPAPLRLIRDYRIRGTMSWEQNGKTYTAVDFYGEIKANFFSLEGNTLSEPGRINHAVNFVLPFAGPSTVAVFGGVGLYPLGTGEYPFAGYAYRTNGSFDFYTTSYAARLVGSVRITRFDLNARAAAGTFEFIASPRLNNTGAATTDQTITNGRFDVTF